MASITADTFMPALVHNFDLLATGLSLLLCARLTLVWVARATLRWL